MSTLRPAVNQDQTRARLMRVLRQESASKAEATRVAGLAAEARITLRRNARVQAAAQRIQSLLDWLHARMVEEKLDALRRGERSRADSIDRDIDELFDRFNAAVREE